MIIKKIKVALGTETIYGQSPVLSETVGVVKTEQMEVRKSLYQQAIKFIPGLFILSLFVFMGLSEFWLIGVQANPDAIADYHFGSEAMMSHGGDKYRSANAYMLSNLITGLIALSGLIISIVILLKARNKPVLKAYCASFCASLTVIILSQL